MRNVKSSTTQDKARDREARPAPKPDERQSAKMHKRLRELAFLHETSQVITATLDLDSVLRSLLAQVRDYFEVEAASVALLDEESGDLVFRVAVGEAEDEVIGLHLAPDQGIAGWVVQTGRSALVPAARSDERFYPGVDDRTGFQTHTLLAVPVKTQERAIGVIEILNPPAGTFDKDAQRVLLAVADLAAAAIRNAELYERVRQAERRYESLFSESADPIVVLDMDWRILDLNQRAIETLELTREQLIGADFCDVLGLAQHKAIQQVREGQQVEMEVQLASNSSDEPRILEAHIAKIDYGGREAIQWIGHDISERVALEQMREDLTHMIVHDLRNPLGSIVSSLRLIRHSLIEHDETLPLVKLLNIAMRSGQKLYRLIDSLLDLGRLEAGETELKRKPVSPKALVQEAAEQIQPTAWNKEQTLAIQIPPDLPQVSADSDLISRVLTNLLDNAVKFTPRGGDITISVAWREDEVLFAVSDTGPGIPSGYRQRIFERFARLENTEGVQGVGLGLAFCKLAVEAHGGRIWAESEMGHGSKFYFTLPPEAK